MEINYNLRYKTGIYCIANLYNGKRYVGSSVDIYNRFHEHLHNLKNNKSHNAHLQAAWNKYGEECFNFGLLEYCEKEVLLDREQYYIDCLKPEYNKSLNVIGNIGGRVSEETKDKISKTLKEKYKTGEIAVNNNDEYKQDVFIYNMKTLCLEKYIRGKNQASKYMGYSQLPGNFYEGSLLKGNRFITHNKLKDSREFIYNYMNKTVLKYSGTYNYLVTEDSDGNLTYYRTIKDCSRDIQVSRSTLSKHMDATKDNPYITRTGFKFYILDNYIETNIPRRILEKSNILLQTNNGEGCDVNPVISTEIKESVPSYRVETEPSIEE